MLQHRVLREKRSRNALETLLKHALEGGNTHHPRRFRGTKHTKDSSPERSNGHLIALDSDAALNAAWARRAGILSHLPPLGAGRAGNGTMA